jgi:gamma-glutamylcyclotransferase (GGCT)/AIG2-like uncharacterized protein YtfP
VWKQFRAEAERKAMFTPDIEKVQSQRAHNVFVYNECIRGLPKHTVLGLSAVFNGAAYTEGSDYVLYKKMLGKETYPISFQIRKDQVMGMSSLIGDPGQIMGEIYTIRPEALISLDNYMLNTVQFERKRVKVLRPFHPTAGAELEIHAIEMWMYVGIFDFWQDQMSDPESRKIFKRSIRLFAAKDITDKEPLGAHYCFDYNLETASP